MTGPRVPRLDVMPARGVAQITSQNNPPLMGPVNKVCDGIDDCVCVRSFREPILKRHIEYDIYQHIPAEYEQRTTYTDTLLHDRRA